MGLGFGLQGFRATYNVDPTFTGSQAGSESNPFTSIAACFAAALALGITNGIIYLAPGANTVESVTFPATGDWEIAARSALGDATTFITGNVVCSSTASARRGLTNINITGTLTGNCSAGTQRILCTGTNITGATTLTQSGAGIQRLSSRSGTNATVAGGNVEACFFVGAVSIAGTFWGSDAIFNTSLAVTATSSLSFCDLPPVVSSTGAVDIVMTNCSNAIGGSVAFTATSGTMRLRPDFATLSELQRIGTLLTGAVSIKSLIGASIASLQNNNVGSTPLGGILPPGLQVAEACLTLIANGGTATGNAVINVIYTDATGALVTEPVTTALNVAGALGSKARGTLPFSQNGATAVSFSVTGVTNAAGLSIEVDLAVRQAS